MTVAEQVLQCMRYKTAHSMWFAKMVSAVRDGKLFTEKEPKIEDFV